MGNSRDKKYFEIIKVICLLAYIMSGFWHIGHFNVCLYVGLTLAVIQFAMSGLSFLNCGLFRELHPREHKVTVFMSLLILLLYILELRPE